MLLRQRNLDCDPSETFRIQGSFRVFFLLGVLKGPARKKLGLLGRGQLPPSGCILQGRQAPSAPHRVLAPSNSSIIHHLSSMRLAEVAQIYPRARYGLFSSLPSPAYLYRYSIRKPSCVIVPPLGPAGAQDGATFESYLRTGQFTRVFAVIRATNPAGLGP
jgi:hypothetical protein